MINVVRYLLSRRKMSRSMMLASVVIVQLSLILLTSSSTWADPLPVLDKPVLATPSKGDWSKATSVNFNWNAVDGATKYEIRYGNNATCAIDPEDTDPMHAGQFAATDAMVVESIEPYKDIGGLADGQWCWQVRAIKVVLQGTDIKSDWSEVWSVRTDTHDPLIKIDEDSASPHFKGTVDGLGVTLVAIIDDMSRPDIAITLDPNPDVSGKHEWKLVLPSDLEVGSHELKVRATDAAGNIGVTDEKAFTVKALKVVESEGVDATITQIATLPLVPTGPLVFVAPTPAPVELSPEAETIIPVTSSGQVAARQSPEAVLAAEISPKLNGYTAQVPVQATNEGWSVFGIAWYWWLLGAGLAALGWNLFARRRLASRLG